MKWINSRDIRNWAQTRDCQENLPLLIRKLIRATSKSVTNIKFPFGDNVLFGGWDGVLQVGEPTPQIPAGVSLWEFGSNSDVKGKADSDYEKRTNNPLGYDPSSSTFVFVTPHLWTKGEDWRQEKLKEGKWKDIRIINAESLEEWLDDAPTVGAWFAKHIGKCPDEGVRSTQEFWEQWSSGKDFNLPPSLLLGGRENEIEKLRSTLHTPNILPIQGMSREESLAFIIASFKEVEELEEDFFARSIIIDDKEAFRQIMMIDTPLVLLPRFDEDSGIINQAYQKGHTILVPLGIDSSKLWTNKIDLPRISKHGFVQSLTQIGISEDLANKYSRESTRNATILRRQLEFDRATPRWALQENAAELIPALLVGRWDENFKGDLEIISTIAGESYDSYSSKITKWLNVEDSPLIKIGSTWRLASPFDSWTNLCQHITGNLFNQLHQSVIFILTEINPIFDLESEQRQYAGLYNKQRAYSNWIREGMLQSLILTAIIGDKISLNLQPNSQLWVDQVITELLNSSDPLRWKSIENKLPLIAEASPKAFLDSVQKYLRIENSPIQSLFDEDPGFLTSQSYHTGLLWALESLAWLPEYFASSSLILALLADVDPGGQLSNRPINSLSEIFKVWKFQTFASFEDRIQVLNLITRKVNGIAWITLTRMLPSLSGDYSTPTHKTRWRMFEYDSSQFTPQNEMFNTYEAVIDILTSKFECNEEMLSALVNKTQRLSSENRNKILDFLSTMKLEINHPNNLVWHELRGLLSHHRSCAHTDWAFPENILESYDKLYILYEPKDVIGKNIWMFDEHPQFADAKCHENTSHEEEGKIITERRVSGLKEIYDSYGLDKIIDLSKIVKDKWTLGWILSKIVEDEKEILKLCELLKNDKSDLVFIHAFIANKHVINGFDWLIENFKTLQELKFSNYSLAQLFIPINQTAGLWNFIDGLNQEIIDSYWESMYPNFFRLNPADKMHGIKKLIEYNRFSWALRECWHFKEDISSELLYEVLHGLVTEKDKDERKFQSYEVSSLFKILNDRDDLENDKMIQLEWLFLPILASYGSSHKPERLHRELANDPNFFIDILKYAYLPKNRELLKDENKDIPNEVIQNRGKLANQLLDSWQIIPGIQENGKIDDKFLSSWVTKVRELATQADRLIVADLQIGKILAKYPEKPEEVWPPEEICEIIENIGSEDIIRNFSITITNKRGSSSRGCFDGGNIERAHAEHFEKLSTHYRNIYPSVSKIFDDLVQRYLAEAKWMDERAERDKLDYE